MNEDLIKLLDSTLKFNPFFRFSANEALKSKLFDQCRSKKMESSAPFKISLDVDRDDSFDYTEGISNKYTLADYKEKIVTLSKEINQDRS
jgi:serine/threonine protein kinase